MNLTRFPFARTLIATAVAAALAAGCATAPQPPAGAAQVRAKLTALQNDANLASQAPVALKDAELAVRQAEMPEADDSLATHRVYIADRKVDTATALSQGRYAMEERTTLARQSEQARLDSRTREADRAKADALVAKADSEQQKLAAGQARAEATEAQLAAAELQRQVELLEARPTDRGLVLTLGDTLFATGKAELQVGARANLERLTTFLNEYPKRTATIEGYTDSMGSEEANQDLSQRRADAVKGYLVGQGIGAARLTTVGRGENAPVADNTTQAGRQQNRRVEVVLSQADGAGS
jgi:outer membrane protein OmpA-like peptidoglycan-associated protein